MFTGIIQHKTTTQAIERHGDDLYVTFVRPQGLEMKAGDSILVNGVCSTVTSFDENSFCVQYMAETRDVTTVGAWKEDDILNIEASLAAGEPLGGHIVQGHVDGVGKVEKIEKDGASWRMQVAAPAEVMRYIVYKGSIAVDGISLTVAACDEETFTVSLIEHTMKHTNLSEKKIGDTVNLESDIYARYVEKYTKEQQ